MSDKSMNMLVRTIHHRSMSVRLGLGILGILLLGVLPVILDPFTTSLFIGIFYFIIVTMSWDLISGYTGQLSLGHMVFFGIGGYTAAILNTQHGLSPVVGIPLAVVISVLWGLILGVPALRLKGPYLALITFIAPLMAMRLVIVFNTNVPILAPDGLGGSHGLNRSPTALVGTRQSAMLSIDSYAEVVMLDYYIAFIVFIVSFLILYIITRLQIGNVLKAIREDEKAVRVSGINPVKFKIFSFATSAMFAGLAGAFFVHSSIGTVQPSRLLSLQESINIIIITIMGGIGTMIGPVLGVFLFHSFGFFIESVSGGSFTLVIPFTDLTLADTNPVPLYFIAILFIYFVPNGAVGFIKKYIDHLSDFLGHITDRS